MQGRRQNTLAIVLLIVFGIASCDSLLHRSQDAHVLMGSRSASGTVILTANEDRVVFSPIFEKDGMYPADIMFSSSEPGYIRLSTNGYEPVVLAVDASSQVSRVNLSFRRGANTLTVSKIKGSNVEIHSIEIRGATQALRGAFATYDQYEAEDSYNNGNTIGPDRTYSQMPSEASQRKAVQLNGDQQRVTFTLKDSFNAISVRYSIPNSGNGAGLEGTLGVFVDNQFIVNLTCTSKYSWTYGGYPFNRDPSGGWPHHFYDEVRSFLPRTLTVGTQVSLIPLTDGLTFTIDLADFYLVRSPYPQPNPSANIVDFGADPSGQSDSTNAINNAINSARSKNIPVWIPQGTFLTTSRITVNQITIRGAGPWYSTLTTNSPGNVGLFGQWGNPSTNVEVYDLHILGVTQQRIDTMADSGFGGSLTNSIIQNVWIAHTKCGMWLDGPFNGLHITSVIIRDTWADGINLHQGISNTVIEQCDLRNTGDDGLAMWSQNNADQNNIFRYNTIRIPVLANGIAIYGGSDNSATDNLISDTVCEGGGLQAANRFDAVPLSGTTSFARNTLLRCGSPNRYNSDHNGAVWIWPQQSDMNTPTIFTNIDIGDSSYSGLTFWGSSSTGVQFGSVVIDGAPYAIEVRSIQGRAYFRNVTASDITMAGVQTCDPGFQLVDQGGNSGWSTQRCN